MVFFACSYYIFREKKYYLAYLTLKNLILNFIIRNRRNMVLAYFEAPRNKQSEGYSDDTVFARPLCAILNALKGNPCVYVTQICLIKYRSVNKPMT